MPGEVTKKTPSKDYSRSFLKAATAMTDGQSREFLWGCTLSKEKPTFEWTFELEDEDSDFLQHTLFLRHAVLGKDCTKEERNIIQVETKDYQGEDIKVPLCSLTSGKSDMCNIDMNFTHEIPVTFRLLEGTGPVHLSAQQLVEFPPEDEDDVDEEYTEDDATATEDTEEEESPKKGAKRKASKDGSKKTKKGKLDSTADGTTGTEEDGTEEDGTEEDDEEDEEESMEDEDEEEEEEDEEEETTKGKKGKTAKGKGVKAVPKKGKGVVKAKKGAKKAGKAK